MIERANERRREEKAFLADVWSVVASAYAKKNLELHIMLTGYVYFIEDPVTHQHAIK